MSELDAVMGIYDEARLYMRKNGNLHQWTNGFPKRELIEEDIKNRISFVLVACILLGT